MPSKNQRKGYESNRIARQYLLDNDYEWVWFKAHQRHQDTVFLNKEGAKLACTDIWGLFDGIALKNGIPIFLQIKTNSWRGWKAIQEFSNMTHRRVRILFINVVKGQVNGRMI